MKKDFAQIAKHVVDIATGLLPKPKEKDAAAVSLGRKGGKARSEKLNPEERTKAAKKAAGARWKKD